MGKKIDLTGQRFGRLVVVKEAGLSKSKSMLWECRCDCGKIITAYSSNLRRGITASCGCLRRELVSSRRKDDLTGIRFGRLLVNKEAGRDKSGAVLWECQCDCGELTTVRAGHLRSGATMSCGCRAKEENTRRFKKNLIGSRFGRLAVIEESGRYMETGLVLWKCLCDCGEVVLVPGTSLRRGLTKSCGCLSIDRAIQNTYAIHGMEVPLDLCSVKRILNQQTKLLQEVGHELNTDRRTERDKKTAAKAE